MPLLRHRAIYFAAYSTAKEKLNGVLEPDSTQVHMVSAGMAGNNGSSRSPSACLSLRAAELCLSSVGQPDFHSGNHFFFLQKNPNNNKKPKLYYKLSSFFVALTHPSFHFIPSFPFSPTYLWGGLIHTNLKRCKC